jgi:hypothetical protein
MLPKQRGRYNSAHWTCLGLIRANFSKEDLHDENNHGSGNDVRGVDLVKQ